MKHRFETATRGELRFDQLISGQFSKTERAIPVQSLLVGELKEEVTFKIVDRSSLPQLTWASMFRKTVKARHLLLVLFPLFYFLITNWNKPNLSSLEIIFIAAGLVVSFFAVQLKIDTQDFISGYDRLRDSKSLSLLKTGSVGVSEVQARIQKLAGVAFGFGLIPLILEPFRIFSLIGTGVLFYFGYFYGSQKKNRFFRDLCLSLTAGPLLAFGILPLVESLVFGFVWSFFIFFSLQIDHFQNYFEQTRAKERNLITSQSFDQSAQTLWWVWGSSIMAFSIWSLFTSQISVWLGTVLIITYFSFQWRKKLLLIKSPVGSDIEKVCMQGHQLYLIFLLLWATELLFKAWLAPLVFLWAQ